MIHTSLWSGIIPQSFPNQQGGKNPTASVRSELFTLRTAPAGANETEPSLASTRSVSPLAARTGYNIRSVPQTETVPTTSWREWLETLRPEVRDLIYSHPNDFLREQLASLTVEDRAWMVIQIEEFNAWWAKMEPIQKRLMALGAEMDMSLAHFGVCFEHPPVIVAAFRCPEGGEDRLVTILADGTKLMVDVPPGFADKDAQEFIDKILDELLERRPEFNKTESPLEAIREFLEKKLAGLGVPITEGAVVPLQEWLETLRPELQEFICANMDDVWQNHLENLDAAGRVELMATAEETMVFLSQTQSSHY